jgi:hypothetical protein
MHTGLCLIAWPRIAWPAGCDFIITYLVPDFLDWWQAGLV